MAKKSKVNNKKANIETPQQMRTKYKNELIDAFVKCSDSNWEDESVYQEYVKQAKIYLGETKYKDRIESGKLIVQLSRATTDLCKKWKNDGEEKAKEKKKGPVKNTALGTGGGSVFESPIKRSDEVQKERQEKRAPVETKNKGTK